ncbi:MAG TPA: 23S rRNA (pseudouridine(1915)-N(3))-methyltransferase RlmH [Gemmatimonadaceae bacterium]|jgi:23S rRNA (pseudouridine1915-N3)-methyltransferase|nr:23S rRNA (pseudouridine(1915)-N(3))-methyltransferase RlmH [Gemmatimonadaceae bacterium]
MRFIIAVVGRPKHDALAAAIRDYEARARRYWPLDIHEVKDEPVKAANTGLARAREGERLAAAVGGAQLVACEVGGRQMESREFAAWVQRLREAASDVAFLIGGAYGLAPPLTEAASTRLSFSSWTMPHELARLVLAEQFYRAGTIIRGEPYHK